MTIDQAATFLAGSILFSLGIIVLIIGGLVINNILHKYWKPVRIFTSDSWNLNPPVQYITQEDATKLTTPPQKDEK
jgi:hypothetical protein